MIELYTMQKKYRGYDIIIKSYVSPKPHNPKRWFCGYARLPDGHVFYGQNDDMIADYINVHGGVTFAGKLDGLDGFYIGFDCAHRGDDPSVQDEKYTLNECMRLVDQLIEEERK